MRKKTPIPVRARLEFFSRPGANGCIEWCGVKTKGYGRLKVDGRHTMAHRVAWEEARGPIPEGLLVCHRCDNPGCINVDHLFLGTPSDNMRDMTAKGRRYQPDNRGRKNGQVKTTEERVREIRKDRRALAVMSAAYKLSRAQLCRIRSGQAWGKVT